MPGRGSGGGFHGGGARGGGGFHGGGARGGGGFHGGGARGGGGPSFRSSTPHSTPFPRTGAQRTISHGPSGPYFHTPMSHPSSHFYPSHHRHWYGYGYGTGYYRGGSCVGCCVCIVFLIIFASIFAYSGLFSGWSFGSNVNYDDTETLYYNDYWSESQYLTSGSQITFSMQSYSAAVTFLISNKSLTSLPTTVVTGKIEDTITLNAKTGSYEYFEYEMIYLKAGSVIGYNFDSTNPVDFFITDGDNFNDWYDGYSYSFYRRLTNVKTGTGTYSVLFTQDYYIVWDNPYATTTEVDYEIPYIAAYVYNYSSTLYYKEAVTSIATTTVTVPNDGYWYFYIYFDPLNSPAYSTSVYYDVTFAPSSSSGTSPTNWIYVIPIIIVVVVIIAGLAIGIRRSRAKSRAQTAAGGAPVVTTQPTSFSTVPITSPPVSPPTSSNIPSAPEETGGAVTFSTVQEIPLPRCFTCGAEISPSTEFCPSCGRKQHGRQIGNAGRMTPASARNCSGCGAEIEPGTKFCTFCGMSIG